MPSTAMTGGARAGPRADLEAQISTALEGLRLARDLELEEMRDVHEALMNRLLERWRP